MITESTLDVVEYSDITCPFCGHTETERMPTDACQYYYDCKCCKAVLRPTHGDCCVFCSYGTVKCPPIQKHAALPTRQPDPLQLVEEGSLERPGPVGRAVRLALGICCLYAIYELLLYRKPIINTPITVLPNIALLVFLAILVINYVINIGFGRSFGRWPAYISIGIFAFFATNAWLAFETPDHPLLGIVLWIWLVYFYLHLGASFVLAAIIATPGCEMRAIPEFIGRVTGRAVDKHQCPAALITRIDAWERGKSAPLK